ncbi:hypothetical protein COLO4_17017 [Corchorus olitorius]|uniref:Uncharacterized protein n=1 Tax=Corchorus olitorius TaxID=93759 RepID=A0A1R3JEK0_9ROSI|nr:hypothetical protein COLO4_17017 [Corchorus olitorius]
MASSHVSGSKSWVAYLSEIYLKRVAKLYPRPFDDP